MSHLVFIVIGVLALLVAGLLAVWVATLVWVYRDAERLRKPGLLVALLIGFIGWPWGLLVWLILRGDWERQTTPPAAAPLRTCPRCGQALSAAAVQGLCPVCLLRQAAVESGAPGPLPFTPPDVAELAAQFPQLEILELLGRGGMGAVYKARQPGLDRFVALKVLPVTPDADPSFAERFQREARALAALSHPHIVAVYEFGQTPTLSYFLMEYVEGANLRQIQRAGRLSPREALAIVPQICDALQFAHDRGIVHRDIKPENILIDQQGRVKIADFGLAKLLRAEPGGIALTETRHVVGTPQYMAPEQVEHPQTVDHRADIYSLGVVFYEMLTGELPLGRFAPPSHKVQVDVRLDEIVLKTLEKEPALRYQQVSEVKTEVQTLAGAPAAPTSTPPAPPAPPPSVPPTATPPPQVSIFTPDSPRKTRIVCDLLALGVVVGAVALAVLAAGLWPLSALLPMAAGLAIYGRWQEATAKSKAAPPPAAPAAAASAPGPVSSRPSNPTKERKMTDHLKLVGVLYVAKAIMGLLFALGVFAVSVALGGAGGFASWRGTEATPLLIVGGILLVLSFLGAVLALPQLIGGIGLIRRKSWARILVLIVSALNLLDVPLGTALAVYAFWALTRTEPKAAG